MSDEPAGPPPPAAFRPKPYWLALAPIGVVALAPLALAYLAAATAELNGCAIPDAAPAPCLVGGLDAGPLIFNMAGLLELTQVLLPMALLMFLVWAMALAISYMAHRRKRRGVADATRMRARFDYYALAGIALLAVAYATLSGWLPAPVLLLVIFVAIFWAFSFAFALAVTLRDRSSR